MKKLVTLILALALCASACLAAAEGKITVRGTATVTADPDIVILNAAANVRAATVGEAQAQVSAIVAAATERFLALGIQEDDIVTEYYNYYPTYNYDGDAPVITGYQANHQLSITCRDITLLDGVADAAVESGMTEINGIAYDISNRHELYLKALALAVEAAHEKAEVLAAACGDTLGEMEALEEQGSGDTVVYANESAAMDKGVSLRASGTGIRSGSVSVQAGVTAVYETK